MRELENVIQRAITLSQHEVILPEDLPASMLQETDENLIEKGLREKYTLDQLEKEYIKKVLIEVGGNKSKAAEILGLDRKTLYRKLERVIGFPPVLFVPFFPSCCLITRREFPLYLPSPFNPRNKKRFQLSSSWTPMHYQR